MRTAIGGGNEHNENDYIYTARNIAEIIDVPKVMKLLDSGYRAFPAGNVFWVEHYELPNGQIVEIEFFMPPKEFHDKMCRLKDLFTKAEKKKKCKKQK